MEFFNSAVDVLKTLVVALVTAAITPPQRVRA